MGWSFGTDARPIRLPSLRRHDPDQVRRVAASAASQSLWRDTPENASTLRRRDAPSTPKSKVKIVRPKAKRELHREGARIAMQAR